MSNFNFASNGSSYVPQSPGGTQAASSNSNVGTHSSRPPRRPASPAQEAHQPFSMQGHHHHQQQQPAFHWDPPSPFLARDQQQRTNFSWAPPQSPGQGTNYWPPQSPCPTNQQRQTDHEELLFMKNTLYNPTRAALTVLNRHRGDEDCEKLLCKLGSCDGAAQRQKIAISNDIDELKAQVRIKQKNLASLEEDCTKLASIAPALVDLEDPFGAFPFFFVEDEEVIKTWMLKRLEKRVNIAAAEPCELQKVLQLTTYEHLNLIPQNFSVLLLTTLHSKEYHKSRKFLNYLKEMRMNGK